jgi:hypothetical protein
MPTTIKDKPQMYKLYEAGAFGNRFRCWSTVGAWWRDHDPTHRFNIRYKGHGWGKFVHYNITADELPRKCCEVILEGYSPKDIHVTEGDYNATDRTLNAEASMMDGLPIVLYSTRPLVMREALAQRSREREGPGALEFLKGYMDLKSYANLLRLFREYPNHVVEFTCYENAVGVLGWNTVFWEVRAY